MAVNYFDLIDRYLDQDLSDEETTAFLKALENDAKLDQAVKEKQSLLKLIAQQHRTEAARNYLDSLPKTAIEKKTVNIRFFTASIAAAIALFIAVMFLFPKRSQVDQLADNYYYKPQLETVRTDENQLIKQQLNALWTSNKLEDLIVFTESIKGQNPDYNYAQLLKGHAYYSQNNYVESSQIFLSLFDSKIEREKEEAQWMLVLIAAKQNNSDVLSDRLAEVLTNKNHSYYKAARKFKKALD